MAKVRASLIAPVLGNCAAWLFCAVALPAVGADAITGPQLEVMLSMGFDSNPAQSRDGPALGFAALALGVEQPLPFLRGVRLEGDAWLRDYAGPNDSGRLDIGLVSSQMLGITQIDLWAEAGWYRDQLVTADERNENALGVLARRPLSARLDLRLFAERRWLDYRNLVLPWAGRPGGIGLSIRGQSPVIPVRDQHGGVLTGMGCGRGPASRSSPMQDDCPQRISPQQRKDRFDLLALETTWFPAAKLSLMLGLDSGWRESSLALDSYRQQAVRLALTFDPSPNWSLIADTGLSRRDYWQAPRTIERVDHQRWLGIALHRWLADGALYCGLDLLDSRSTIEVEAFRQWSTECGWQRRF
ncbi:MAG: hypothetical protein K9L82_04370 [Chromatiaceae bacterium]|nr:hypothetical protein [Chromatiaceae bacterium]MCF7994592.1 hypothetical protein [Chromatiaceae bacterium]MCF8014831.1 hypothetical protein [Chromatiaceae bacterium]